MKELRDKIQQSMETERELPFNEAAWDNLSQRLDEEIPAPAPKDRWKYLPYFLFLLFGLLGYQYFQKEILTLKKELEEIKTNNLQVAVIDTIYQKVFISDTIHINTSKAGHYAAAQQVFSNDSPFTKSFSQVFGQQRGLDQNTIFANIKYRTLSALLAEKMKEGAILNNSNTPELGLVPKNLNTRILTKPILSLNLLDPGKQLQEKAFDLLVDGSEDLTISKATQKPGLQLHFEGFSLGLIGGSGKIQGGSSFLPIFPRVSDAVYPNIWGYMGGLRSEFHFNKFTITGDFLLEHMEKLVVFDDFPHPNCPTVDPLYVGLDQVLYFQNSLLYNIGIKVPFWKKWKLNPYLKGSFSGSLVRNRTSRQYFDSGTGSPDIDIFSVDCSHTHPGPSVQQFNLTAGFEWDLFHRISWQVEAWRGAHINNGSNFRHLIWGVNTGLVYNW